MRLFCGIATVLFVLYAPPPAAGEEVNHHVKAGLAVSPPIGWVDFCNRLPLECIDGIEWPQHILFNGDVLETLGKVNRRVNHTVVSLSDQQHYNRYEYWAYPDDGYGDCEDYVLEKRRALMRLGFPLSVLLITVVVDKNGEGHAVLLVRTDKADLVLDNTQDAVLPWWKTNFRKYIKRQSQMSPNVWVSIGQEPVAVGSIGQQ